MSIRESVCTRCGARFESDAKFCGFDGAELFLCDIEDDAFATLTTSRSCPTCSKRYPAYAAYCGLDGTSLGNGGKNGDSEAIANFFDQEKRHETRTANMQAGGRYAQTTVGDSESLTEKPAEVAHLKSEPEAHPGEPVPAPSSPPASSPASSSPPPPPPAPPEPDTPDHILTGKVLDDKYRIEQALAEGGMAVLYIANQINMDRKVVVKVMHGSLMHRADAIERFKRECKLVAKLQHPNIVSVYDFGFRNGKQPFLVMEYIRGKSLGAHLDAEGPMKLATAKRIILQTCSGLEEAHSCGIVHRDLKPDNIILQEKTDRPDWVKIVDFGIAHLFDNPTEKRLTRSGVVIGTPEYMAPEQFTGKPLDARTDIYALGLVFFEMLTGEIPFDSPEYELLMARRLMERPPGLSEFRSDVAKGSTLEKIVSKCLAPEPMNRFQKVTDLRKALEEA